MTNQAESALASDQAELARLKTFFSGAPVGILVANADGSRFLHANPTICRLLGYSESELLSLGVKDIHPPEALPIVRTEFEAQARGEKTLATALPVLRKDGAILYTDISASPVEIGDTRVVIGFFTDITERMAAEQSIKEHEARLRAIMASVADTIIMSDRSGRIIYVNRLHPGLTLDAVLASTVFDFVPPEQRQVVENALATVFARGEIVQYESFGPGEDGLSNTYEVRVAPLMIDHHVEAAIFRATDITERKRVEKTLQARDHRFAQLIQNSYDTVVILDADGIQRYVSPAAERVHGYAPSELVDIPVIEVMIHPDDRLRVQEAFQRIIATGSGGAQYRHRRKSGGWVHLEARGTNQLENPDIRGVVVNVRDVTDRVQAEEAFRESEDLFRKMVDNSPIGMHFYRLEGERLIFSGANPAADKILGVRNADFIGKTLEEAFPPIAGTEVPTRYRAAAAEGIPWQTEQIDYHDERIAGAFEVRAFQTAPGQMVSVFSDITKRKKIEKERESLLEREQAARRDAEAAVRSRDEFLSVAAHDLKTPLSALRIQLDGMRRMESEEGLSREHLHRNLDILDRQSRRLVRLINSLLTLTRIQAGRLILNPENCELGALVREVCERHSGELEKARCVLELDLEPEITGLWDGERLEQILENLVSNASKFGAGAPIRIETRSEADRVTLTIRNSGAQIADEMLERIFEPFERASASVHLGGLGMGLYIARRIAMAHGGSLRASNRDGTAFTLELPRRSEKVE